MNKKETTLKKKSRAKYQCPSEIARLIELVNLVPLNIEMESDYSFLQKQKQTSSQYDFNFVVETFYKFLATFPKEFQNYINSFEENSDKNSSNSKEDNWSARVFAFREFYELRETIMIFTKRVNEERKGKIFYEFETLKIQAPILRDKNGRRYLGGVANLIGKFQDERLRICDICSRLFWAKRKESETCSPKCFNAFRQRLYRTLSEAEKAQRKTRRQENSKIKKILKGKKEK